MQLIIGLLFFYFLIFLLFSNLDLVGKHGKQAGRKSMEEWTSPP